MKDTRSFRIFDVAFALEAAGVAANRELDFVLGFDGEVEPLEGIRGPVRLVIVGMALPMLQQGEADFSRLVGRLHGPASVLLLHVRRKEPEGANEGDAGRNNSYNEFFRTHDVSFLIYRADLLEKTVCVKKYPRSSAG